MGNFVTCGKEEMGFAPWRLYFIPREEKIHPEGRRPKGWIFTPKGWIRQPEGCKTQFFLIASAWKHISFTYISALVKFIPWDEFCNSSTKNFREINSSHGCALKNSCHGMNFVILTLRISVKSIKRRFDEIFVGSFRKFSY